MQLFLIILLGVGILLIYSAMKGETPREVVERAFRET